MLRGMLVWAALVAGPVAAWADEQACGQGPGQRHCPHGDYPRAHYWFWGYYEARAFFHPSYLDQYPPGPQPSVQPTFDFRRFRCPPVPPTPGSPYIDPEGYFGRQMTPR